MHLRIWIDLYNRNKLIIVKNQMILTNDPYAEPYPRISFVWSFGGWLDLHLKNFEKLQKNKVA
jgi:hypothetical protein